MDTRPPAPDRHWLARPVESGPAAGFGVYLHVPFCHHRCGYCDFATAAIGDRSADDQVALYDRYTAALVSDLRRQVALGPRGLVEVATGEPATEVGRWSAGDRPGGAADGTSWPTVTSVFIGGGTPSLLGGHRLATVLDELRRLLDVAPDVEITVECNPESSSPELFSRLVAAGVDRVSLGAQSFSAPVLRVLERGHDRERPLRAVGEARAAGIREISLDLIYGTPGETDDEWARSVVAAVGAGVDHLSAYALTIHDNTPFGRAVDDGTLAAPDDDVQRVRFDVARDLLASHGFEHYELSNWARRRSPDDPARTHRRSSRSQHNLLYWRHGDYLGVGVGAHAHLDGRRWWSTRSTGRYLDAVEDERSPITSGEVLDDEERATERLLLGLRVREGLHPADTPPIDPLALEDAMALGLIETACGRIRCTDDGWFLLDEAVRRLR